MVLKRAVLLIVVLGLVHVFGAPASAQTVLNFPRVISSSSIFTGLAVGNPTSGAASVTFTAFQPDGTLFAAGGSQNPVTLQIPAGGQAAKLFSDIFGSSSFNGWVQATSSATGLTGFFLNGNFAETDLDGAGAVAPVAQFVLPFAAEDAVAATEITIVNVNANAASPTLTLYGFDGSVIATKTFSLPANSLVRQTLTGIFGQIDFSNASHAGVNSDLPVIGHEVVANYLVAGTTVRRETAALSGQPGTASTTYVLPQFATGGGWLSLIGIVNASGVGQQVTLTAYNSDGTVANVPNNPRKISLDGNASLRTTADQFFGFPNDTLATGWIQIKASLGYIGSYIAYGNNASPSFAAVAGTDTASASTFEAFSQVAQGVGFYTGLTLVNPGTQPANVQFYTLRPDGTTVGQSTFTVQPNQRVGSLFSDILPASLLQVGGWAYLQSSQPIIGAVLFGTQNGDALANVPQQIPAGAFTPPAQTTAAIDGTVSTNGQPIANVQITLSGPVSATATSDASGHYVFPQLPAGTYVVTAVQAGAQFVPAQRNVTLAQQNVDGVNFEAGGLTPAGTPAIQFVTPSSAFTGSAGLNVRVLGSNFTPVSVVQANGQPLGTSFVSSTEIDAVIPAVQLTAPGTIRLTVLTPPPGGGASAAIGFSVNPVPSNPLIEGFASVGSNPSGVAIDAARHTALVSNQSSDNVFVVDLGTLKTISTIPVGRSPAEGIGIDPLLNLALVANPGSNNVTVIDLTTNTAQAQPIKVGNFPVALAVNATTHQALVTNASDGTVSIIDLKQLAVTGQFTVGTSPKGIAINASTNQAVVTNSVSNDAWIIDLSNNSVLKKLTVGQFPRGVAIDSTTNVAVVANANSNNVSIIDLNSRSVVATLSVGTGPTDVAIHELTNTALVTNSGVSSGSNGFGVAGSVSVIDLAALVVSSSSIPVGSAAFGIGVDQTTQEAVVANFGDVNVAVLRVPNPTPRVGDVNPKTFPAGGADFTLDVTGTGFLPTSVVTVNGQTLPTTFVSSTDLKATVSADLVQQILQVQASSVAAARTLGGLAATTPFTFIVSVTNPSPGGGNAPPPNNPNTTHIQPTNPVPVLVSISPTETTVGSGPVTLSLSGNGFNATSIILFGGSQFSPSSSSARSMTVTIPANVLAAGTYPVSVNNPAPGGGNSVTSIPFTVDAQSNPAPNVSSVNPTSIPAGSGATTVTVQGTGFISTTTATLGSVHGVISGNTITFSLSASDTQNPGTLSGLISNPAPGGGSTPFGVSVLNVAPTVTGFAPTTAQAGSNALGIQVSGTNFRSGSQITVQGTPIPTQFLSNTQLSGTIPASFLERSGNVHIGVMNSGQGGGSADGGTFTISSSLPTLTSAVPANATVQTTDLTIQLTGTGFTGNSSVAAGTTHLVSVFNSSTSLTVTIPAALLNHASILQLVATNPPPGGGSSAALNFPVQNPAPILGSVSPSTLTADQQNPVLTLTGQKFATGATVTVGTQTYTPTSITSTQITVTLTPPLPLGHVQVTVTNPAPGGGASNAMAIDITPLSPTITGTAPNPVAAGGTLHVTGTNFGPGSTALINGQTAPTHVNSTTALDVTVPASLSPGNATLAIQNPVTSGNPLVSASVTITIGNPVPVISSLNPSSAFLNQSGQQITVLGTGFVTGAQVQVGGTTVSATVANSATLTFTLPLLSSGTSVSITVVNPAPGGGASNSLTLPLNIVTPVVLGVSPNSGQSGSTVTITVGGSSFLSGAVINFAGAPIPTQFLASSALTGSVTLGAAGIADVSVTNPGGVTSGSVQFTITSPPPVITNPAPSVTSLSPASVTAGAATFSMTITGSNFISGTTVTFGSTSLTVSSQTSTSLIVSVPASLVTSAGNITVTVTNPGPGGGQATAGFSVNSATIPAPTALSLLPSPAFVALGASSTVTVSVDNAPSTALTVALSLGGNAAFSSNPSNTSTTVTIAAGATSVSTQVFGATVGTTTLSATASGLTSANITVNVLANTSGSLSVSPSPITLVIGSSSTIAITRPATTVGTPLTVGLSAAPAATLSVPTSITFPANASVVTTNITALASGGTVSCGSASSTTCLIVAGPEAPSLLTGRVINFVPSGLSTPSTVAFQTYSSSQSSVLSFTGSVSGGYQVGGCVDDCAQSVGIPFAFPFYGRNYSSVYVGTNGYLTFGFPDTTYDFTGEQEFLVSQPRIAAMATDLIEFLPASFPNGAASRIFTNTVNLTGGHQALVVVFENIGIYYRPELAALDTFQVVLFDTGAVQINYKVANNATASTTSDFFVGLAPGFPQFTSPNGVWSDGTYTYVADTNSQTIRRITNATEQVVTIAGLLNTTGATDGAGSNALFNNPVGIWGDGAGNLYITETGNNAIRKLVASTGQVTTLVASTAGLNLPSGIWGDGAGNLYVASSGDHTIRKVVIASATVSSLAGASGLVGANNGAGSAARFNDPAGIWGDGAGTLYVADALNHTIRTIAISSGQVSTLTGVAGTAGLVNSGTGAPEFSTPIGIWGDGHGNLFVTESGNNDIRKIVISGGTVSTFAGSGSATYADGTGTAASFHNPAFLFGDTANLYIPDTSNNLIRKAGISSAVVTTLAGNPSFYNYEEGSYSADGVGTPIANPQQTILGSTNTIPGNFIFQDFNPNFPSAAVSVPVTITTLQAPTITGLDVSSAAASSNVTVNITGTGFLTGATVTATNLPGVTVGTVTVNSSTSITVSLSVASNASTTTGSLQVHDSGGVSNPVSFTVLGLPTLTSMSPSHAPPGATIPVQFTGTNFGQGSAVTFANAGVRALSVQLVSSTTLSAVVVVTGAPGTVQVAVSNGPNATSGSLPFTIDSSPLDTTILYSTFTIAGQPGVVGTADGALGVNTLSNPHGLWNDAQGDILFADKGSNLIRSYNLSTGSVSTVAGIANVAGSVNAAGTSASFSGPIGAWSNGANLYIADSNNGAIRVMSLNGSATVTTLASGMGSPAGLWGDSQYLYVADKGDSTIKRVSLFDGTFSTFVGGGTFSTPHGIWGDGTYLYVTDSGNNTIRKIQISSQSVTILAGGSTGGSADGTGTAALFQFPTGIWGDGSFLYVADQNNDTIRRIDPANGNVVTIAGLAGTTGSTDGQGSFARFTGPHNIWGDGNNLYVSDTGNSTIRKLSPIPVHLDRHWTGAISTAWNNSGNWQEGAVPGQFTTAYILATASNQPTVTASISVGNLLMDSGATLTINSGVVLTSTANVKAGNIVGPGTLTMSGTNAQISGIVGNLTTTGTVQASAGPNQLLANLLGTGVVIPIPILNVTGTLSVQSGTFQFPGQNVAVSGNFETTSTGQLIMSASADLLKVAGNVTFGGGATNGLLTNGTMVVGGNFMQGGTQLASFAATGGHRVKFAGTSTQTVSFAAPGISGSSASYFQDIEIATGTGGDVSISGTAYANGNLLLSTATATLDGSGTLQAGAMTMNAAGAAINVANLILSGTNNVTTNFVGIFGGNVRIQGAASMTGVVTVNGNLTVTGSTASLDTVTYNLTVQKAFAVVNNAIFKMTSSSSGLTVGSTGSAVINGGDTTNSLTAGTYNIAGTFALYTNGKIAGTFTGDVYTAGNVTLTANTTMNGRLLVDGPTATETFDVAGFNLSVALGFSTTNSGVLKMATGTPTVTIGGDALFSGGNTTGLLTNGTLIVGGYFAQSTNANSFVASGTATKLTSSSSAYSTSSPATISFANPTSSHFATLELEGTNSPFSLSTNVVAAGQLVSTNGATTVKGNGNQLQVSGLAVTAATGGFVMNHVIFSSIGGTITNFNNVTLQSYAATDTQFTLQHAGGSFTFNNLTFSTLPSGGYYMNVSSSDGNALAITLNAPIGVSSTALMVLDPHSSVNFTNLP